MSKILAFDFGASSGRAVLGNFTGSRLDLEEIHRFENEPVSIRGSLYWDILRLYYELGKGLTKCINKHGQISSLGIDTWGVDFGLLDAKGKLLGNPCHYRDSRTDGMMEKVFEKIPKKEIYIRTGIQFMQINTIYQLMALKLKNPAILEQAETLLLIPDLLNYFLTGVKSTEFTNASTTQLYDIENRNWSHKIIKTLEFPEKIFTEIIQPGTIIGKITDVLPGHGTPVISTASHDTASAVASVPTKNGDYAYISCGTWSLMGIETEHPIINEKSFIGNFTNEGGINGKTRFLKNIMGLWIVQECRRYWENTGKHFSFADLEASARKATPFASFIDPDSSEFASPGDMPLKIRAFCIKTGQPVPSTEGELIRCVMQSLALKYRYTLENLEDIAGRKLGLIHMVGGGCKDKMLCQFTANACARQVAAGPTEATAIGNIAVQAITLGLLANINEARDLIRTSFPPEIYQPENTDDWEEAYAKFKKIVHL